MTYDEMKEGVFIGFNRNQIGFDPDTGSITVSGFEYPLSFDALLGNVSVDDVKNLAAFFTKLAEAM